MFEALCSADAMATWMTTCTGVDGQPACCDSVFSSTCIAAILDSVRYALVSAGCYILARIFHR